MKIIRSLLETLTIYQIIIINVVKQEEVVLRSRRFSEKRDNEYRVFDNL